MNIYFYFGSHVQKYPLKKFIPPPPLLPCIADSGSLVDVPEILSFSDRVPGLTQVSIFKTSNPAISLVENKVIPLADWSGILTIK